MTVETSVNCDSKNTNERGSSLVGSLGFSYQYSTGDLCSALAALVGQVENILSSLYSTLFQYFVHLRPASSADSRAGSPVPVSVDTLAALRMRIGRYRVQN